MAEWTGMAGTDFSFMQPGQRIREQLSGVSRCPHCGVADPVLAKVWKSEGCLPRATPGPVQVWAAYRCTTCGSVVLAKGKDNDAAAVPEVAAIIPAPKTAHEDIPDPARTFLQQAYQTLRAPDAAAVMAGSAVDAMLKSLGYSEGSVYLRIDQAVEKHALTKAMGNWPHEVRLGSNRPRHADASRPHVSPDEAQQSVDFAEALGFFLFVLTNRIRRGMVAAKTAATEDKPPPGPPNRPSRPATKPVRSR